MKLTRLAMMGLLLGATAPPALSDGNDRPASGGPPVAQREERGDRERGESGRGESGRGESGRGESGRWERPDRERFERMQPRRPIDEAAEWEEIIAFMNKHSPRRWEAYQGLGPEMRERLKPVVVQRHRAIQRVVSEGGEELRDLKEKQVKIEDELFGLRQGLGTDEAPREQVISEMREKVRELVMARMKERELRITRLMTSVEAERKKLEVDRQRLNSVVEEHVKEVVEGPATMPVRPERHGRPGDRPRHPGGGERRE